MICNKCNNTMKFIGVHDDFERYICEHCKNDAGYYVIDKHKNSNLSFGIEYLFNPFIGCEDKEVSRKQLNTVDNTNYTEIKTLL